MLYFFKGPQYKALANSPEYKTYKYEKGDLFSYAIKNDGDSYKVSFFKLAK